MDLTVVLDLLVALELHHAAVLQFEAVAGLLRSDSLTSTPWNASGLKRKVVQPLSPWCQA